jgi:prepilin-type N-terminal cleavage/methylation domain
MTAKPSASLRLRRASGFTLIELLTVIAIIGILAAIIIPVVGKVRQSARASQSIANLRTIAQAVLAYSGEHRHTLPFLTTDWSSHFWTDDLEPYVGSKVESALIDGNGTRLKVSPVFISPILPDGHHHAISDFGASNELFRQPNQARRNLSEVRNPSRTVAIAAAESRSAMSSRNSTVPYGSYFIQAFDFANGGGTQVPSTHGMSKAPLAFLDGHVEQYSPAELTEQRRTLFLLNP